jgi:hypothetical protein
MPVEHCPRCHQIMALDPRPDAPWISVVCETCRAIERAPQGEAVRLFAPAPNQITGQLTF